MDTLATAIEPLVVQSGVDGFGGWGLPASRGCPEFSKPLGSCASAEKARTMACREGDSLIEEEQLRPASTGHDHSAAVLVFKATDEPCLGRPAPVEQSFCRWIVDDATIAGEGTPLRYGDNIPKGCHAVLKMHGRLGDWPGYRFIWRQRGAICFPRRFSIKQNTLAIDTPGVLRERTVIADHAMARNGECQIVRSARSRDRTGRLRGSDASRYL